MDNKFLEQEHEDFVNSDNYLKMIKEKIEFSEYYKYNGVAPEGFTLLPNELLDELKILENWLDFKEDPNWVEKNSKNILKRRS